MESRIIFQCCSHGFRSFCGSRFCFASLVTFDLIDSATAQLPFHILRPHRRTLCSKCFLNIADQRNMQQEPLSRHKWIQPVPRLELLRFGCFSRLISQATRTCAVTELGPTKLVFCGFLFRKGSFWDVGHGQKPTFAVSIFTNTM